ncbi:hypothetical protein D3C81_2224990 [compost metagenome]
MREKGVLLTFIKAVDFIHKQYSAPTGVTILTRTFNRFTNFFHTRGDGRNAFNVCVRVAGDHFSKSRFTRAWRSP